MSWKRRPISSVGGVAGDVAERVVDEYPVPVGVEQPHADRGVIEDQVEVLARMRARSACLAADGPEMSRTTATPAAARLPRSRPLRPSAPRPSAPASAPRPSAPAAAPRPSAPAVGPSGRSGPMSTIRPWRPSVAPQLARARLAMRGRSGRAAPSAATGPGGRRPRSTAPRGRSRRSVRRVRAPGPRSARSAARRRRPGSKPRAARAARPPRRRPAGRIARARDADMSNRHRPAERARVGLLGRGLAHPWQSRSVVAHYCRDGMARIPINIAELVGDTPLVGLPGMLGERRTRAWGGAVREARVAQPRAAA